MSTPRPGPGSPCVDDEAGGLAPDRADGQTRGVLARNSFSFAIGPLLAFAVVGVLALLLRWAFGSGRSLVARRPRPGDEREYGLLVTVANPATQAEAEAIHRRLVDARIRVTLAPLTYGPPLMVFPQDAEAARRVLRGHRPPGVPGAS